MSYLVLAAISDLFFASKLKAQAAALDLDIRDPSPELALSADLAIIHLGSPGVNWREIVAELKSADPSLPIVGFGRHTEGELFKQARDAGCDKVVANSVLALELEALIERYARPAKPGVQPSGS